MDTSVIVTIVIIIIIIIIIGVVIVVVLLLNRNNGNSPSPNCTTNADCSPGFICSASICKAASGTRCTTTNDCAQDLICLNSICTNRTKTLPSAKTNSKNIPTTLKPVSQKQPVNLSTDIEQEILNEDSCTWNIHAMEKRYDESSHLEDEESCKEIVITKLTEIKDIMYESPNSTDDEINSNGSDYDEPFDIKSADTEDEEIFRTEFNNSIKIYDAISYSQYVIYILPFEEKNFGSTLVLQSSKDGQRKVHNNIMIEKIMTSNGYLFAISKGILYKLPMNMFEDIVWEWKMLDLSLPHPIHITNISATYDEKHFWISNGKNGYLIDSDTYKIVRFDNSKGIRNYGQNMYHYIEVSDDNIAIVYPEKIVYENVAEAILSYHNEPILLRLAETKRYRKISLVNWKPLYIRK